MTTMKCDVDLFFGITIRKAYTLLEALTIPWSGIFCKGANRALPKKETVRRQTLRQTRFKLRIT